jgi:phage-related protein
MTAVFPLVPSHTLTHSLKLSNHIVSMGDGFEQRVNKNLTFNHADGEGNNSSYKGINTFKLVFKNLPHVNNNNNYDANKLWAFYKARNGSLDAFYFYNPSEGAIDTGGNNTTGRYLVRFTSDSLSRDNFMRHLYNYGLDVVEVRA